MVEESPGRVAMRLHLERKVAEVGRVIGDACPPGHGFALFMFEFGKDGSMAYISSAERDSVALAIEEWLGKRAGHSLAAENFELRQRVERAEQIADDCREQLERIPSDAHDLELAIAERNALQAKLDASEMRVSRLEAMLIDAAAWFGGGRDFTEGNAIRDRLRAAVERVETLARAKGPP